MRPSLTCLMVALACACSLALASSARADGHVTQAVALAALAQPNLTVSEPEVVIAHLPSPARERRPLTSKRVSLGAPLALIVIGASVELLSWGIVFPIATGIHANRCSAELAESEYCAPYSAGQISAILVGAAGAVPLVVGATMLGGKIRRRSQRRRALKSGDGEFKLLGMAASFSPWMPSRSGAPAGLTASLRF
jgi:hypothetical protein